MGWNQPPPVSKHHTSQLLCPTSPAATRADFHVSPLITLRGQERVHSLRQFELVARTVTHGGQESVTVHHPHRPALYGGACQGEGRSRAVTNSC